MTSEPRARGAVANSAEPRVTVKAAAAWAAVGAIAMAGVSTPPSVASGAAEGARPGGFSDHLFVLTTDYSTGSSSTVGLQPPWNVQLDVEPLGADPVARYAGGLLYVVNRLGGDNLQVIDPATATTLHQYSVGAGTNPQDVAVLSPTRAYVSLYNSTDLLEMNPTTGQVLERIDLSVFSDTDGLPEAAKLHFAAPYLYVQIQRLDRSQFYAPVGDSYLAVIDTRDNTVVDVAPDEPGLPGIALEATNPFGAMELDLRTGRRLIVPCPGAYTDQADGGLELVDLDTWTSEGVIMSGAQLGGDLVDISAYEGGTLFVIVSNASFVTCLAEVDLATSSVLSTLYCSSGFDLADCTVDAAEGWLYLADRSFDDPGVRVFDLETGTQTSGPIYVGLPPVELHILRPGTSGGPFPQTPAIAEVHPNPSRDGMTWQLSEHEKAAPIRVVDSAGRRVRELTASSRTWDGRDEGGRLVPAGAYWLVLDGSQSAATPVRVLR